MCEWVGEISVGTAICATLGMGWIRRLRSFYCMRDGAILCVQACAAVTVLVWKETVWSGVPAERLIVSWLVPPCPALHFLWSPKFHYCMHQRPT